MRITQHGKLFTSSVLLSLSRETKAFLPKKNILSNCLPRQIRFTHHNQLGISEPSVHHGRGLLKTNQLLSPGCFNSNNPQVLKSLTALKLSNTDDDHHLSFPKKTKKDLFLKNYRLSKGNDVRHIIPLFLIKQALSKAHFCHGDDPKLLEHYASVLKSCGANADSSKPHLLKRQFYTQIAKCRFNVFVGNSKENSLLGHYGYRLFEQAKYLTDNLFAINHNPNAHLPQEVILKLSETTKQHLISSLLLNKKKDSFSLSFLLFIQKEFEDLNKAFTQNPEMTWSSARQALLNKVYLIRDAAMYDAPKGQHEGLREKQNHLLKPAYCALMFYTMSEKADINLLLHGLELIYLNERACLSCFPDKSWNDLYPLSNHNKTTNTYFATKVGQALLMP